MSDGETDFAAFEAQVAAGEPADPAADAKTPADGAEAPDASKDAEGADELVLTPDDEAVDVPEGEEGGEAEEGHKRRSKPAGQRIAELTAKLRQAERDLEAARGKPAEEVIAKPDPAEFEFGEADPAYIEKLTDWKIETREAEKAKAEGVQREQQAMVDRIQTGIATAEETAKAKYDDFDARVAEAVEARAGEPLPPVLSIALGVSPVGGDLIYRLATDEAMSEKLEKLAKGGPQSMNALAMAMGELEGEYIEGSDDSDLDMSDNLDMARMMGRMRARLAGKSAPAKPVVTTTEAPEPPQHRVRGGAGKFEVGADTTDFAAFERKANAR